jgi:hypothetical protein
MSLLRALVVAAALALAFGPTRAFADPVPTGSGAGRGTPAPPRALAVDAVPLFGPGSPAGERWFGCVVRLANSSDQQVEGYVEVESSLPWSKDEQRLVTRAPFAVAGKGQVALELPSHGFMRAPPAIKVRAHDNAGKELGGVDLPDPRPIEPVLMDFSQPSRIGPGLRGMRVAVQFTTPLRSSYSYTAPSIFVATPPTNPATGDAVLPDRAAAYAGAAVVLAKSDQIASLQGPELDALAHWVLGGGALAVVMTRPEDVRAPTLTALAGAEIRPGGESKLGAEESFVVPSDSTGSYGYGYAPRNVTKRAAPAADVKEKLRAFLGGNLHASPWGASASYGLGELHLLAFDATREPAASDEWVKLKMVDLVRHSWDRQVTIALPHAATPLDSSSLNDIRKQLDPNEGARWAIVVALLMLIAYAMLAGPLNFYLASKRGKPLTALWHLPIWAGGAMGLIVALGAVAKGVSGRARHLSLIEAGAGMNRAAVTRFRGFYASAAEQLLVRGTDRESVLDVAGDDEGTSRILVVDRDGARLEKFQAKPWETVVVREDGFVSLGGGVSITAEGSDLAIKNRTARDLIGVVVWRPKASPVYFPRLKDGQSVLASAGRALPKKIGKTRYFGSLSVRDLDADAFASTVEADVKGAGDAWRALDTATETTVDWWPDDVPVLIAQLEGGEGKSQDSGLRVDSDRVFVRVVGYGGVP